MKKRADDATPKFRTKNSVDTPSETSMPLSRTVESTNPEAIVSPRKRHSTQ